MLRKLFLITGIGFFVMNLSLNGIAVYKQYKQVRMMSDMQKAIQRQMEYYERNTPVDPRSRTL